MRGIRASWWLIVAQQISSIVIEVHQCNPMLRMRIEACKNMYMRPNARVHSVR